METNQAIKKLIKPSKTFSIFQYKNRSFISHFDQEKSKSKKNLFNKNRKLKMPPGNLEILFYQVYYKLRQVAFEFVDELMNIMTLIITRFFIDLMNVN